MKVLSDAKPGARLSALTTMYPSVLAVFGDGDELPLPQLVPIGTAYGIVVDGSARLHCDAGDFTLASGAYFSVPCHVHNPSPCMAPTLTAHGRVVVIARHGVRGQFVLGMLEDKGRLSYIDGCSDTLLVYPPRRGDPVLNHLYFPPGVVQTQHTHPSIRLGVVIDGSGDAFGPMPYPRRHLDDYTRDGVEFFKAGSDLYVRHPLKTGTVFLLEEHEQHGFCTMQGQGMHVVAYHPDSDWGPTDECHPMLNRTYLRPSERGLKEQLLRSLQPAPFDRRSPWPGPRDRISMSQGQAVLEPSAPKV